MTRRTFLGSAAGGGLAALGQPARPATRKPNDGEKGAMLLDPRADPFEMKNLADDPGYARVCAELSPLVGTYAANLGKTQV